MRPRGRIDLISRTPPLWWQIVIAALISTTVGVLLRVVFRQLLEGSGPFITFFASILMGAIWGGLPTGLVTVLASTLVATALNEHLVGPAWHGAGWGLVALFWIAGAVLAWLGGLLRRSIIDLAAAHEQAQMLIAELQHRGKNLLTVVQALALQTARRATSVGEFEAAFAARLGALLEVQSMLADRQTAGVDLRALLTRVVACFDVDDRCHLNGPDLNVVPDVATPLALVVNELATNAIKYGALGAAGGRVDLHWSAATAGAELVWKESGGPPVVAPTATGFGSRLVASALPPRFGTIRVDYEPDGVRAAIRLSNTALAAYLRNSA